MKSQSKRVRMLPNCGCGRKRTFVKAVSFYILIELTPIERTRNEVGMVGLISIWRSVFCKTLFADVFVLAEIKDGMDITRITT
jgi:hypothetical protein